MQDKENGYLTVFLSLILVIMVSLCLVLIKGAYDSTMRLQIECGFDTAMNNILAEYHRQLLEQYDLFFVDTSYGSNHATLTNTKQHFQNYINQNLNTNDLLSDIVYTDFLSLSVADAKIEQASVATDEMGKVYRSQAIQWAKENAHIGYIEEIKRWIQVVNAYSLDSTDIEASWDDVQNRIEELDGSQVKISENEYITISIENPVWNIYVKKNSFLLNLVLSDTSGISSKKISLQNLLSYRYDKGNVTTGNGLNPYRKQTETVTDLLFFQEYLMHHFGCYTKPMQNRSLDYEIEYCIAGKDSDVENLKSVIRRLLTLREAANFQYLLGDIEKRNGVKLVAALIALISRCPDVEAPMEYAILFAWSFVESLYDVSVLLKGGKIPLLKAKGDWHYSYEGLLQFQSPFLGEKLPDSGLEYGDYLRIFLTLDSKKNKTLRSLDLIEQNIRLTKGNTYFRMDACVDSFLMKANIKSKHGQTYEITRRCAYE